MMPARAPRTPGASTSWGTGRHGRPLRSGLLSPSHADSEAAARRPRRRLRAAGTAPPAGAAQAKLNQARGPGNLGVRRSESEYHPDARSRRWGEHAAISESNELPVPPKTPHGGRALPQAGRNPNAAGCTVSVTPRRASGRPAEPDSEPAVDSDSEAHWQGQVTVRRGQVRC
jgi:hypothetical protein